ncbi:hypothetical protein M9H77_36444 [Catharanthus roseus]|uniref:Uncharacterized protein n=1 Tax=Catharanthus roseus TaxID=4058 RepID=A0ACB9ZSU9_CATRO|nr:hypothetical protein M9H77_36444 [Catharanthus roseus]
MNHYGDYLQENIILSIFAQIGEITKKFCPVFRGDVDPNTFEEFLEPEEYIDHGHLFTTDQIFNSKVELVDWAKETAMKVNTYFIITRYLKSRTSDRRPYVTLACKRGGAVKKKNTKLIVDDEEEEVPIKSAMKIYNVVAKIKKNRMQGRNTVEELLCLSTEQDYTVCYRNCEDSNILSDAVIAYPTSIAMIRTWSYVLIMDTTYKTNKYTTYKTLYY